MPGRDKRGAKQGQKGWDFKQEKEIEEMRGRGGERRVERGVERVARVAPFEEPPSVMENGAYCLKNKADWRNKTEGLEDVEARRRLSLEGNARWLGAGEVERVNQRMFGVISFDLAKSPVLDGMTWSAVDMRIAKIVRALRESTEELLKHLDVKVGRGKGRSAVSAGVREDTY